MIHRLSWMAAATVFVGTLGPACMEVGEPEGDELGESDVEGGQSDGAQLYNQETFGGNGRTCKTCHPVGATTTNTGTLNPAQVDALFRSNPNDPLFRGDGADVVGGNTFNRIRQHATVLITLPLAPNITIKGSRARTVTVARGIPTTNNTPALDDVLMYDGREPTLQQQAGDAIIDHAGSRNFKSSQLDAIASFQKTLFNRSNLKALAQNGTPLKLPYGTTDSEKRGRRWFIDDNKTSPGDVGESKFNVCGFCHSGDMLNGLSGFFVANVSPAPLPEGFRFFTVLVSEFNALGNPVHTFEFHNPDGSVTEVESPDLGIFLQAGEPPPVGNGFFKIPTVWGVKETAPYFHDNSSNNLTELMNHYDDALFILSETDPVPLTLGQVDLTEQDKKDIIAYMKLL
jgi:cytochrome c peroxidase